MSLVVLLILAVVWAVFLVPQVVRARAEKGPSDSIGAFRNQLSVLERSTPVGDHRTARSAHSARPALGAPATLRHPVDMSPAAARREDVRRRRQSILVGLLAVMAATLLLGLLVPALLLVHVVVDMLFVAYCALLVRVRNVAAEREMKVRYLPGPQAYRPEPALLLQRSGS